MKWELRASGDYYCKEHNRSFKPGIYCEDCAHSDTHESADEIEAASRAGNKRRMTLTLLEHEVRFIRLSFRAEKISNAYTKERPDIAVRALSEAIKAGRAAAEMCAQRDEWERVERLERAAERMQKRRDALYETVQ